MQISTPWGADWLTYYQQRDRRRIFWVWVRSSQKTEAWLRRCTVKHVRQQEHFKQDASPVRNRMLRPPAETGAPGNLHKAWRDKAVWRAKQWEMKACKKRTQRFICLKKKWNDFQEEVISCLALSTASLTGPWVKERQPQRLLLISFTLVSPGELVLSYLSESF